ncbi:unnamed protein product [Oncorhynchus mykiss]|uniref:Reverse transcriptase domain-containing protein n=1 Tax=Oncorhynchus mykiss TaxID=8022 RepID=A0A060XSR7_ONCMY|nr:unnamed protein product [Oncorhynchus mykiss]
MQSGFRAGHGCTSATLKVLNDIITAIDKRHYCAAVFIDLAKAFDSVNHHILIGRLDSLSFSNDCLAWFTNYFSDRVQCVKSEGLLSGPLAVSMRVPQGSILGPTLFSVYINDVALAAGGSLIYLYADNTILYSSGPSLDTVLTNLQTSFNAIEFSFRCLQLLLNAGETKCMLFNRSLPAPARLSSITTLDGSDLEYVDNYKYLGVWLDCKLSFQTHIKHLQSKIKSRIGFLYRNKASFTHAEKNASLLLRGITLQDQGRYKCYTSTIKGNMESFINIAVEAPVRLVDIQLSDDIITCSSTGIYAEPKLTWSTDPPSDLSFDPGTIQNSTSIKVDDQGLYDITSTKQFSRNLTNICTVTSGTVERTATLKQQDPVQGSLSSEVSIPCSVSQSDLLTFDLTWTFKQIVTILTSTSTNGTAQMYVVDKWKEQVQNLSDSGSLQLHKLTMVHQGTYSCELSTARDTHLILTYLQITPDKLSDVSDGLSPGSITGIIIAAVIIAAVICYLLRVSQLKVFWPNTKVTWASEEGESLSATANTNGPNENSQSGKPLQNEEERKEDIERQQE